MTATERDLARIQAQVRRKHAPLRGAAAIGMAVGAVVNSRKVGKHFTVEIGDSFLTVQRRVAQIEQEARLDGIYVIHTSMPAEQLDAKEAVQAYKVLEGADLRRAHLQGAVLFGANLDGAVLLEANLDGADLRHFDRHAELEQAAELIQAQIDQAYGDAETRLPTWLTRPVHWGAQGGGAALPAR
jgi:hypothetical protein